MTCWSSQKDYPSVLPKVDLCTPLPHPNIFPNQHGCSNYICLDVLEKGDFASVELKDRPYTGWSSSYTVSSLLVQIASFLLKSQHDKAQARQAAHEALLAQHQQNFQSLTVSQQKRKQKKRQLKKQKKRQLKKQKKVKATQIQEPQKPVETTLTTVVAPTEAPSEATQPINKSEEQDGFEEVKKSKKEEVVEHQWSSKRHAVSAVTYDPSVISSGSMGNLDVLPYQMIISILELLPVSSVNAMSFTCRSLHQTCQDGVLWQALFKKNHPHSQLSPQNMKDQHNMIDLLNDIYRKDRAHLTVENHAIRHFYQESTDKMKQLQNKTINQNYSKVNFLEDVLSLPIIFTVNPRTQQIDYVYSSMDILSRQAFYEDKVRKTVWKEKFTHFLPIYIDEDHFRRALPIIKKTMSDMCGGGFDPSMVLYILPKLMNTTIVLLMDKGVYASQKALDGYWMIHRLFIAMVQEYPQLKPSIDKRLRDFAMKEECRNVKWKDLCWVYLNEVFDRNVLWIGKEDVTLVTGPLDGPAVDHNRLKKTFEAVRVSLRLTLFHVHFLRRKGDKKMDAIASEYDLFYGRPNHTARSTFQNAVAAIINCPDTSLYWNSLKKGYHTARTNFGAIQESGVSSILKRGETYKTSSQLKKVKMEESWGWTGCWRYLDASCLAYAGGKRIGYVDYSHTRDLSGSIAHSGDVIDHAKNEGKHTINVYLGQLPKEVDSLWFIMTAFTGDLKDIKQPFVRFTDEDSDEELCRYNLESQSTGSNTAIIMCSMTRIGSEQWSVKAIGHIGMGKVPTYGPIEKDIKELMKKK
ncbi:hypothetical protein PROFUN_04774 [Planoprotostelium fungivorum]|uniref:F-box domain-containing protein n=1 Tax=Planoprotostelium fungivorum TaxID=1890364 RepID=A0A2P6NT38_9EUKA|nr:hypothetical protein PROFUN_04774 [Planoprotostelium fungivorum]